MESHIFPFIPSATSCADIQNRGVTQSGIYLVHLSGHLKKVFCDLKTTGGGWTVCMTGNYETACKSCATDNCLCMYTYSGSSIYNV